MSTETVLSDLTVTLAAGSTVALVGENGSGKTTLVKLLLGMYTPASGSILVDGTPLGSIAHDRWRARCTAAFQDFARFSLPAVESVGVADLPAQRPLPLVDHGQPHFVRPPGRHPAAVRARRPGPAGSSGTAHRDSAGSGSPGPAA